MSPLLLFPRSGAVAGFVGRVLGPVALFLSFMPPHAGAQLLPQTPIVNNLGAVNAVIRSGSTVYIGGVFDYVGPVTGSAALLDLTTGNPLAFPGCDRFIYAVAPDGAGGWYVGGQFSSIGGKPRNSLAHVKSDLTVDDDWAPSFGTVSALAVGAGVVYVGGSGLSAFDATTGALRPFNASPTGTVSALVLSGSTLYAGGNFNSMGGQPRNNLAALDATTGNALSWTADTNSPVFALLMSGSVLYVGGQFTALGGFPRNRLGAVDAATATVSTWNPNVNGIVNTLALSGTTLYVGGNIIAIGATSRTNLAAVSTATGLATAWNPGANAPVLALAVQGSTVYAAGSFTTLGGQTRLRIAAVDAAGVPTAWNPSAGHAALALGLSGTQLLLGGQFASVGGRPRSNLAAFDATTGAISSWNPGVTGDVRTLASDGTNIYVGGAFTNAGGQARNNLASLATSTGLATAWNPNANAIVHHLVLSGGVVYVGGEFSSVGGMARANLAALNTTTGAATAWNPGPNGFVQRIVPSGGLIYVGGGFTSIAGQPRGGGAALNPATGAPNTWDPMVAGGVTGSSPFIHGMSTNGTVMYLSGNFTIAGGAFRNYIAGIDMTTGAATPFNPNATQFPGGDIIVAGSKIYAALARSGLPVTIGGQPRWLAGMDPTSGAVTGFNPPYVSSQFTQGACGLALDGSILYLGGLEAILSTPMGPWRRSLAAWDLTGIVGVDPAPSSSDVSFTLGPNPASSSAHVSLSLAKESEVRVGMFDLQGREVARLFDGRLGPGSRSFAWDCAHHGSGVYFVLTEIDGRRSSKPLVVLR